MPQPRRWRDLPVHRWTVCLQHCHWETECPTHGRLVEEIPWTDRFVRVTYRFEYAILKYSQIMTQKAAVKLLRLPISTLSDLLHPAITRLRDGHRIRGLTRIGVDQISNAKVDKQATLVYNLDKGCMVWVGQGKGRETIDRYFPEPISKYQCGQIETACCDMNEAYIGVIHHHCPDADLVLDRLHIAATAAVALVLQAFTTMIHLQMDHGDEDDAFRWEPIKEDNTPVTTPTASLQTVEINAPCPCGGEMQSEFCCSKSTPT